MQCGLFEEIADDRGSPGISNTGSIPVLTCKFTVSDRLIYTFRSFEHKETRCDVFDQSVSWAPEVRLPVGVRDFYVDTALELTQVLSCPSSGYEGFLLGGGYTVWGVNFSTDRYLVPRFRMRGATPNSHTYVFMEW